MITRILAILSLCTVVVMSQGQVVSATALDTVCSSGAASQSAVCQDSGGTANPLTGGSGLLAKIASIIAVIAGMAAVIIIVLGGYRLITSGGSSENVAGARRSIIYAAVGLVIIVIARLIIGIILNAL